MVLAQISEGITPEKLLKDYPYLSRHDIDQALKYAAWTVDARESEIVPA
jgi:uncharacterized protein (DUF433 family)